jgi:hypothetical protein
MSATFVRMERLGRWWNVTWLPQTMPASQSAQVSACLLSALRFLKRLLTRSIKPLQLPSSHLIPDPKTAPTLPRDGCLPADHQIGEAGRDLESGRPSLQCVRPLLRRLSDAGRSCNLTGTCSRALSPYSRTDDYERFPKWLLVTRDSIVSLTEKPGL